MDGYYSLLSVFILCVCVYCLHSSSQRGTSASKHEETGAHLEEYSDESSEEAEISVSGSSLSKLSSERGFSPTLPETP